MTLFVKKVFPGASIQDNGRPGLQRFGLTAGGAVDTLALNLGRALFGDKSNTSVIEFSGAGGKFIVKRPSFFASTGANSTIKLNGVLKLQAEVFSASEDDEIEVSSISTGFYSYLHVAGGFLTAVHFGSRSGNIRAGLGTILKTGDYLPYASPVNVKISAIKMRNYTNFNKIRLISGPQTRLFSKKIFENFLKTEFTITSSRDRMGIRLGHQDKKFDTKSGLNVLSEAIEIGDIQIDGQGVPTILLNDRQPTGGYPRIATVISADLHKVAQIGVNSTFKFTLVSLNEAIKALKDFTDELSDLENEVFNLTRDPRDIDNLLSYGLIDGAIRGDEYEES